MDIDVIKEHLSAKLSLRASVLTSLEGRTAIAATSTLSNDSRAVGLPFSSHGGERRVKQAYTRLDVEVLRDLSIGHLLV